MGVYVGPNCPRNLHVYETLYKNKFVLTNRQWNQILLRELLIHPGANLGSLKMIAKYQYFLSGFIYGTCRARVAWSQLWTCHVRCEHGATKNSKFMFFKCICFSVVFRTSNFGHPQSRPHLGRPNRKPTMFDLGKWGHFGELEGVALA